MWTLDILLFLTYKIAQDRDIQATLLNTRGVRVPGILPGSGPGIALPGNTQAQMGIAFKKVDGSV